MEPSTEDIPALETVKDDNYRNEGHMDWMLGMKVGDPVDALKFDTKYKLR